MNNFGVHRGLLSVGFRVAHFRPLRLLSVFLVLLGLTTVTAGGAEDSDKLLPIFDGKTLNGWEGNQDYFRVEDKAIVAGTLKGKIPHNEFLCTKKKYADFELVLEVKLVGKGNNAGVQFRSKRIPDDTEVSGYQCDAGVAWDRPV
ncbi:MAG TPA: hypothetical protein DDW52_03435, partial [Planctomycetaceae bacterium]|nr:hypothetical protein [Planctomycetaceae bacterium]